MSCLGKVHRNKCVTESRPREWVRWSPVGPDFVQWSLRRQRCRPAASTAESRLFLPFAAHRAGAAPGAQAPSVSLLCQSQNFSSHTVHDGFSPPPRLHSRTREIKGRGEGRTSRPFKSTAGTGDITAAQILLARLLSQEITPCHKVSWKMWPDSQPLLPSKERNKGRKQGRNIF